MARVHVTEEFVVRVRSGEGRVMAEHERVMSPREYAVHRASRALGAAQSQLKRVESGYYCVWTFPWEGRTEESHEETVAHHRAMVHEAGVALMAALAMEE